MRHDDDLEKPKFAPGVAEGGYVITITYMGPHGPVESTVDLVRGFTGQLNEKMVGEVAAAMFRALQAVPAGCSSMQTIALS